MKRVGSGEVRYEQTAQHGVCTIVPRSTRYGCKAGTVGVAHPHLLGYRVQLYSLLGQKVRAGQRRAEVSVQSTARVPIHT